MIPIFLALAFSSAQPDSGWTVTTSTGVTATDRWADVKLADLMAVHRTNHPLPAWPVDPHVILANGDRIPGKMRTADNRSLTVDTKYLGQVVIPLTAVSAVWFTPLPAGTPGDPLLSEWMGDRKADTVRLTNGDVFRGSLDRFDEDRSVWLKIAGSPNRKFDAGKVVAVSFSTSLSRVRSPKGVHAQLVLSDGTRLTVANVEFEKNAIRGEAAAGFPIEVADERVISISIHAGNATYLSDLKPKRVQFDPYLSAKWPPAMNRTVKGNPLALATKQGLSTFDRGIGMHARTTMEYDLAGRYRRFESIVGLDANTGRLGRVPVRILVDGKEQVVDGLKELTAETGPVTISLDVSKAKLLTLIVDHGPNGDANADVNWCDARLINK
jgi:hypothetical protein